MTNNDAAEYHEFNSLIHLCSNKDSLRINVLYDPLIY